ncbi:MAG: hypothetical protein J1E63_06030 [Muribaculaceae bacterium]|nr:hypothetical protein [Muribaculaceae bacterium]
MKKIFSLLMLVVMTISMATTACSSTDRIDAEIRAYQKHLPEDLGDGMVMTNVAHEGNYIVYTAEYNESEFPISLISSEPAILELLKAGVGAEILQSGDSDIQKLLELMRDANMGMKYVIIGLKTGEQAVITFTPEEIQSAAD